MAIAHISNDPSITPFVFSSLDRAGSAAKRLKSALELYGQETRPLGWYKKVTARIVGYDGWDDLRLSIGKGAEPGRLDHDMRRIGEIWTRRRSQARLLAKEADLPLSEAEFIIDQVEPTGNGSGPFRLWDIDENAILLYRPPDPPSDPDGRLLFIGPDEATDRNSPFGTAHMLYDHLCVEVGHAMARSLTAEVLGFNRLRFALDSGTCKGFVTIRRVLTGHLYSDEPRPLRPTEIQAACQEWQVQDCSVPRRGQAREDATRALGIAIAATMIREMVWALIAPRPPIVETFAPLLDINEGLEDQVGLAEVVAGMHAFGLENDAELANAEDTGVISGYDVPSFRIVGLCREILPLDVTDE